MKKIIASAIFALALFVVAGVASASYDFGSSTLRVGSKGDYVKTLQTLVGASADGNFGPMTAAKVKAWQASNGLVADGVFGPLSMAKANLGLGGTTGTDVVTGDLCPNGMTLASNCMTAPGAAAVTLCPNGMTLASNCSALPGSTTVGTGTLTGGAGSLSFSDTQVDIEDEILQGATNTKILAFRAQATGSDISLNNIKVSLQNTNLAGTATSAVSTRLERYASEVSVWMGSKKVGTASVSNFVKDGTVYSANIALTGAVIKEGAVNKETFYVTISALSNIDSFDIASDQWKVKVSETRYTDGSGLTLIASYVQGGDSNIPLDGYYNSVGFNFIDLASSGDVKLNISKGNTPAARNVKVSDTGSTSDVLLNEFKIKATGSEMTVSSITVNSTASGALGSVIASQYILKANGAQVADITSIAAGNNIFNLYDDLVISKDSTVTFTVTARINKISDRLDDGNIGASPMDIDAIVNNNLTIGDSLKVDYVSAVAEDVNGDPVTVTSGVAAGETQSFTLGLTSVEMVGTPISSVPNNATKPGTVSFTFKVTATEKDATFHETTGVLATVSSSAVTPIVGTRGITKISGDATLVGSTWTVLEGDNATFALDYTLTPTIAANSGTYRVTLDSVAGVKIDKVSPSVNIAL